MVARKTKLLEIDQFSLGLNYRSDQFQMDDGESPDLIDVDVDPRGGFATRRPVTPVNVTALSTAPKDLFTWGNASGVDQLMAKVGTAVHWSTGGNFTAIAGYAPSGAHVRMASFKDRLYMQDGVGVAQKWDGSTRTALGTAFSPTIGSPTGGNMPIAKLITTHAGYTWVANTVESATAFPNRVRFSHPNLAEDWRAEDNFDLDIGHDGDEITALLPFNQQQLIVFKRRSVYVIFGSDVDTFSVQPLSHAMGAPDQESVCASATRAFWWSWPEGVFAYDGKSAYYIFDRIRPAIQDGRIAIDSTFHPSLSWYDGRLYVGVKWTKPTTTRRTFVYDPSIKTGCWTAYSLPVVSSATWKHNDSTTQMVMALSSNNYVVQFQAFRTNGADNFGGSTANVIGRYRTKWFDVDMPSATKRWRAPRVISIAGGPVTVTCNVYHDYNSAAVMRQVPINIGSAASYGIWDTSTWDNFLWGVDGDQHDFDRIASLGAARAIQLEFVGPNAAIWWGVDALSVPYITKRIR